MRILSGVLPASIALLFTHLVSVFAGQPISSLSVTLRGKKYDVSDVTTVKELQEQIEAQSGVSAKQQGRVIFGGKRLGADTVLSEAGVPTEGGGHLNMVPSSTSSSSSSNNNKKKAKPSAAAASSSTGATASASAAGAAAASNPMADYLKQSGVDTKELDEMMKKMGGGADGAKGMEQGMQAMTEAMKSPLFQQMMSDPEKLEQSRQMILSNPMLKSMMSGMPGMEDLLNDPDAWREAMQAAADLYKNMDSDELMKAMTGGAGAGGMPGMGGAGGAGGMEGLFDGTLDDSTAAAALDELDED